MKEVQGQDRRGCSRQHKPGHLQRRTGSSARTSGVSAMHQSPRRSAVLACAACHCEPQHVGRALGGCGPTAIGCCVPGEDYRGLLAAGSALSSLLQNEIIRHGLVGPGARPEFQQARDRRTVRVAGVVAWRRRFDHAERRLAAQSGSAGTACGVGCPGGSRALRLPCGLICPMRFKICSKATSAVTVGPGCSGSKPR